MRTWKFPRFLPLRKRFSSELVLNDSLTCNYFGKNATARFHDESCCCSDDRYTHKYPVKKKTHGAPDDQVRHVGDLGNIISNGKVAEFSFFDEIVSFAGDTNILGRAIVIHENPDDLGRGIFEDSNSTGHAGARLACAVIKNGSSFFAPSLTFVLSLLILISQR